MTWTAKDLQKLSSKGLQVVEQFPNHKPAFKQEKISVEKNTIEFILKSLIERKLIKAYTKELKFDEKKRYRFDYVIPEHKLAIEYEGLISEKSGHTTLKGYSKDCSKYNLAQLLGWKVLRYTALNYLDFEKDITIFLNNQ